jgi:hypothetical protein
MNKDDQRVRETVQAELRRRRGALDRTEERTARTGNPAANGHNGHSAVRLPPEERHSRRPWTQPPSGTVPETSGK